MNELRELYSKKSGKLTDKWSLYLDVYHEYLSSYQSKDISLLEIGVQNGGSLDIWCDYFKNAKRIVGCDINTNCSKLSYSDQRVELFVEDATLGKVRDKIINADGFDIIIDDGSHESGHIIKSFCLFFEHLNDGGVYIAEDLHCSYWDSFEGGLYFPYSSISFFKKLADITNFEHWGNDFSRKKLLSNILDYYNCELSEGVLKSIHSITFVNSICIIKKCNKSENVLGERVISGQIEDVVSGHKTLLGSSLEAPSQMNNYWSTLPTAPEEHYKTLELALKESKSELVESKEASNNLNNKLKENVLLTNKKLGLLQSELESKMSELDRLRAEFQEKSIKLEAIASSSSWRLTYPIRFLVHQIKRAEYLLTIAPIAIKKSGGFLPFSKKLTSVLKSQGMLGLKQAVSNIHGGVHVVDNSASFDDRVMLGKVNRNPESIFHSRILIIAELSIPQCKKYRVTQKQEMFNHLGYDCTVLSWTDYNSCIAQLSLHSLVIFYRVPAFESVVNIINEAKRLKLRSLWEVDDLIFDKSVIENSRTLKELDAPTFEGIVNGAGLYHKAMSMCDEGIASTEGLADAMKKAGVGKTYVVENALDTETLERAEHIFNSESPTKSDAKIRIVYGSGTSTHNIDFEEAAKAIKLILDKYEHVIFRLIGKLELPKYFDENVEQIERIPFCDYNEYLSYLAECDISIAPLEPYVFNDSKSNIKYIEASIVGIPSICSPASAFQSVIKSGKNGILARNENEWFQGFSLLIENPKLRSEIGLQARENVKARYHPHSVASEQLSRVIANSVNDKKKKILSVNIYYSPRSFGGATVVAEEMDKLLAKNHDYEVFAVTTLPTNVVNAYEAVRYEYGNVTVFGIGLPDGLTTEENYENKSMQKPFRDILRLVGPDLIHIHCIQGIGVAICDIFRESKIPYIITLHDAWWLCGRQFMINRSGRFCNQVQIDESVCAKCVDNPTVNKRRTARLKDVLNNAELLLSPSKFFADFFKINDMPQHKVLVNKNGITDIKSQQVKLRNRDIVFGYVGGNTNIKGVHLVKKAFTKMDMANVKLVVVDNGTNLGLKTYSDDFFGDIKNVDIIPAYDHSNIDDFFNCIDVLLFPTQWKESFGLTVREAIVRNVWVIATDAGGVVEDIIEGKNGIVIPFDSNADILYDSIIETIEKLRLIKEGEPVLLPSNHIRRFSEQADELHKIYSNIFSETPNF